MSIYVLIGIMVFALISKRLFSFLGKQITDSTQPILDEKKKKSIFEEIFGEFYTDVEDQNILEKDMSRLNREVNRHQLLRIK